MKYYLFFTVLFGLMLGWQAFLVTRDNKMFEVQKQRYEQICKIMPETHADCNK